VRNLPGITASYWLALVAASVFGTNTGDFVAGYLHLGHLAGLPCLGLLFGAILLLAKRARRSPVLHFWAAIITVRTAATNVGDAFHDFHVAYGVSVPVVLALFAASVLLYRHVAGSRSGEATVRVNAVYWLAMMLAGVLGTIGGDCASYRLGLTPAGAACVFGVLVALSIWWFRKKGNLLNAIPYWTSVGLIRTAGTATGDALAGALGLPLSTALTGLVFAGLVAYFTSRARRRVSSTLQATA